MSEADEIKIDDFTKVDLRVARIVKAEAVEGADKLLRLQLDVGALGERQVFAGIKSAYSPESLTGMALRVPARTSSWTHAANTSETPSPAFTACFTASVLPSCIDTRGNGPESPKKLARMRPVPVPGSPPSRDIPDNVSRSISFISAQGW